MKALVGIFNQEQALEGTSSVIVKLSRRFVASYQSVISTEYEVAASQELVTELSLRLHKTCPDPETTNQHNNALYFITPLTTFPIRS